MTQLNEGYLQPSKDIYLQPKHDSLESLEIKIKELRKICDELNPYAPLQQKYKKELCRFQITEFHDPFTITNKLLVLLEDALEELEIRKKI